MKLKMISIGTEAITFCYKSTNGNVYKKGIPLYNFELRGRSLEQLEGLDISDLTSEEEDYLNENCDILDVRLSDFIDEYGVAIEWAKGQHKTVRLYVHDNEAHWSTWAEGNTEEEAIETFFNYINKKS
jgi:hypothetical protein